MEEKLEEFKRRRRREVLLNRSKLLFRGIMNNMKSMNSSSVSEVNSPLLDNSASNFEIGSDTEVSSVLSDQSADLSVPCPSRLTIITYILYFLLWVVAFMIAVHFEFGYVYLIVSGLVFIYLNTRTGPKKKGEISAYSVFNPNCEAIDGTLKAEQFEREFNLIKHEVSPSPR